jgi:glycosyltransferase involved in cell wall biosynthesis
MDGFRVLGLYFEGDPNQWSNLGIDFVRYSKPLVPRWNKVISQHDIDLIHRDGFPLLNPIPTALSEAPVVSTAHGSDHLPSKMGDIEQYRLDESHQSQLRLRFDQLVEKSFQYNYDYVLTVSDWVRDALIQNANYPPEKVITTMEPIGDAFFSEGETTPHPELPNEYIFHVSYAKRRKNLEPLIQSLRYLDSETQLIIAGSGWEEYLSDAVESEGIEDVVRFEGYVDQDHLIHLYDNATCFVLPSLQENFGLPNVEAMARGTPVVTSKRAAIPEVCGQAVEYIEDPSDPNSIAVSLDRVLRKKDVRQCLSDAGRLRAQRYRWQPHVENMVSFYTAVLNQDTPKLTLLRKNAWHRPI